MCRFFWDAHPDFSFSLSDIFNETNEMRLKSLSWFTINVLRWSINITAPFIFTPVSVKPV